MIRAGLVRLTGMQIRPEPWGAIVSLERPAALLYVDRRTARGLGIRADALWSGPEAGRGHSAPVEVHWTLSRRCDQGCPGCYTASVPQAPAADLAQIEIVADALAEAGVLHVALGGGEPLADPATFAAARALRARGIAPSTTTSGAGVTARLVERLGDFAQINVSIDGVGPAYAEVRGPTPPGQRDRFEQADMALRLLRQKVKRVGINAVLTRHTFDGLEALVAYGKRRRVTEIELLRLKPAGRGRAIYRDLRLTPAQRAALLPKALHLTKKLRVPLKMDCASAPFICQHDPDPRVLRFFRIGGCEAGDTLASVDPQGRLTGCSFLSASAGPVGAALGARWVNHPLLEGYRRYRAEAPAPCNRCPYVSICNGGCRAVSAHLTGDPMAPDPECLRVMSAQAAQKDGMI